MKPLAILNKYFNTPNDPEGYVKKTAGEFREETKELTNDEKMELAQMAADDMGVEIELI